MAGEALSLTDDGVEAIGRWLGSLALPGVAVGLRRIDPRDVELLHPIELEHVRGAAEVRRAEFSTGRRLLRTLLGDDGPIPVGVHRAPVLPAGAVASLAHDCDVAVAAASTATVVRALGIDVEPAVPIAADVAALILREDERGIDPGVAFSLKEAAYKAWRTLGGRLLDHGDVRITLDGSHYAAQVLPGGIVLHGRWATLHGRYLALVQVS